MYVHTKYIFVTGGVTSSLGKGIFSASLFQKPEILPFNVIAFILVFVIIEWLQRDKQHALELDGIKIPRLVRY